MWTRRTCEVAENQKENLHKLFPVFVFFYFIFSLFGKKILFRLFIIWWNFEQIFSSLQQQSVGVCTRIDSPTHWTVRNKCNECYMLQRTTIDRTGSTIYMWLDGWMKNKKKTNEQHVVGLFWAIVFFFSLVLFIGEDFLRRKILNGIGNGCCWYHSSPAMDMQ